MKRKNEKRFIKPSKKLNQYLKIPIVELNYLEQMIKNVKEKRLVNIVIAPTNDDYENVKDIWMKMSVVN